MSGIFEAEFGFYLYLLFGKKIFESDWKERGM